MKNMKIIVGLTFLGVIASMNLVAANRGKKNKAAEAAEVEEQVEVKEDTSKRNIKKIRKDNSEGTQSMPTPEALQEISSGGASSNSSSSAISWCSKKISMEDIQAFLEGFEAKQQELLLVMEAQGFSPLAAAAFLALDDENFTCLLEGVKKRDLNIKSMLTSRACVKITADGKDILNSANLMKLLFSARQLSPIVSGIIGRTPESLAKWFARRITMWKDALKVTGTHFIVMGGYSQVLFEGMPEGKAAELIVAVNAGSEENRVGEYALKSQSEHAVEWCKKHEQFTQAQLATFKINSFYEDLLQCPQIVAAYCFGSQDGSSLTSMFSDSKNIDFMINTGLSFATPERMAAMTAAITDEQIAQLSSSIESVASDPRTTKALESLINKMPASLKNKLVKMAAGHAVTAAKTAAYNAISSSVSSLWNGVTQGGDDEEGDVEAEDC